MRRSKPIRMQVVVKGPLRVGMGATKLEIVTMSPEERLLLREWRYYDPEYGCMTYGLKGSVAANYICTRPKGHVGPHVVIDSAGDFYGLPEQLVIWGDV